MQISKISYHCFIILKSFRIYLCWDHNTEDIDGFHDHHTCRLGSRSGGRSIYVKNCWNSEPIDDLCISNETIEISTVRITLGNEGFYVLGIYRPHFDSICNFLCVLADILSSDKLRNKICTVLGDLNINILESSSEVHSFLNLMQSHYFVSMKNKPTRFPTNEIIVTISLDHVWTKNYLIWIVGYLK